jgi:hypothetical protein
MGFSSLPGRTWKKKAFPLFTYNSSKVITSNTGKRIANVKAAMQISISLLKNN